MPISANKQMTKVSVANDSWQYYGRTPRRGPGKNSMDRETALYRFLRRDTNFTGDKLRAWGILLLVFSGTKQILVRSRCDTETLRGTALSTRPKGP